MGKYKKGDVFILNTSKKQVNYFILKDLEEIELITYNGWDYSYADFRIKKGRTYRRGNDYRHGRTYEKGDRIELPFDVLTLKSEAGLIDTYSIF